MQRFLAFFKQKYREKVRKIHGRNNLDHGNVCNVYSGNANTGDICVTLRLFSFRFWEHGTISFQSHVLNFENLLRKLPAEEKIWKKVQVQARDCTVPITKYST